LGLDTRGWGHYYGFRVLAIESKGSFFIKNGFIGNDFLSLKS
jgi:hypothetical protein